MTSVHSNKFKSLNMFLELNCLYQHTISYFHFKFFKVQLDIYFFDLFPLDAIQALSP